MIEEVCIIALSACVIGLSWAVCRQRRTIWMLTGRKGFRRSYLTIEQAQRLNDLLDDIERGSR